MALTNEQKTLRLKVELEIAQTNANAQKLKESLGKLDSGSNKYKATLAKLNLEVQKNINANQRLNQMMFKVKQTQETLDVSTKEMINGKDGKGGLSGVSAASGSASAATLELGRVISDAPYGIRGVANNVSQLASNLVYASTTIDAATQKAIGFSGAMKAMWASIKGPLGILLAIQAAVAALDYFYGSTSKANDGASELADSGVTDMTVKLGVLKKALNDTNLSLDIKKELVSDANSEIKDLNLTLDENEQLTTASSDALDAYVDNLMKAAQADALVELMKEQVKEQMKIMALGEDSLTWYESLGAVVSKLGGGFATAQSQVAQNFKSSLEIYNKFYKTLTEGENPIITGLLGKDGKDGNGKNKIKREFRQLFLDLEKDILSFQKRTEQIDERGEIKRLELKHKYEQKDLDLKRDAFIEKMNQSRAQQDELLALGKIKSTQHGRAIAKIEESIAAASLEHERATNALSLAQIAEYNNLRYDLMIEQNSRAAQATFERDAAENALEQEKTLNSLERIDLKRQAEEDSWANEQRIFQERIDAAVRNNEDISVIQQESEAGLAEHQANMVAIDESAIQARINALGHYGDAAKGLSTLLGEQTEIGKMFAIAAATIDTYAAANKVLNDETIPSTAARVAAMIAVISTGIANVRNISKTEVPTKGAGGGASQAAGATTFNPNFNIVGASGRNQLAETVAGQVGEPTRAYVVYDDIATAGEIEANAIQASGI